MASVVTFEMERALSNIPVGADPFVYVAHLTRSRLSITTSTHTLGVLAVLLFFHSVIVLFCIFLLIMSYASGAQHARWFIKSLYINDRRGHKVYNCPLYSVNAGLLMTISQMFCSAAAIAYVCVQLMSTKSSEYAVHPPIFPPLAVMCICETISHWSAMQCFLVTIYASRGFRQEKRRGLLGWISPPIFLNALFFGFPISASAVAAGMFGLITFRHHQLAGEVTKALDILLHASSDWKQLHSLSLSSGNEMSRITMQLVRVIPRIKEVYSSIGTHLEIFLHAFYRTQLALMVFSSTTWVVFIVVFCFFLYKYQSNATSQTREQIFLPDSTDSEPANLSRMRRLLLNKQLYYLLMRALGIFLSILTQQITCFILVIKNRDVILENRWREIGTWLVIVSGTWSAVPIAWQSWRLYLDQTGSDTPPMIEKESSLPPSKPFNLRELVELEMQREKDLLVQPEAII